MFNKLKGTKDIYGNEAKIVSFILSIFKEISKNYNFDYIETPIIEDYNLFVRTTGETSDIVTKEMYTFYDNGNRKISLRPEGTASVIRAFVENKINNLGKSKFYYFGPMFRYERPQKGRYRQFLQGGIELIEKKSILSNFEVIKFAYDFLNKLKIDDFVLEINNLGSFESRNSYIKHLQEYFLGYEDKLSEISKLRVKKNVLRILDDKEEVNKDFVKNAPKLLNFLPQNEIDHFNALLDLLNKFGIKYVINPYLVRGLDYYNDIVFEFVSISDALGSKSTILAGGRYDGMIESFGGPDIGSIGFAFGIDRIAEIIAYNLHKYPNLNNNLEILIAYLNEDEASLVTNLAYKLREHFNTELINHQINIKQLFKLNYKLKPKVLIFKELGLSKDEIKIKTQNKETILSITNLNNFVEQIKELI